VRVRRYNENEPNNSMKMISIRKEGLLRGGIIAACFVTVSAIAAPSATPRVDKATAQQIAELQAKIKQLEAALPAKAPSPPASPAMPPMNQKMTPAPAMPGMTPGAGGAMGMGDMKMGGMTKDPSASGTMPGGGNGGMNGMMGMMGQMMGMMGQMMGMGGMSPAPGAASSGMPQSALPGFPGVSHLYHIGATGFFLDHSDHIRLSSEQQASLNRIREKAVAAKSTADAQIEQAEQELGTLTSADQPDAAKIEAKVREIEKLRADQRLAFIRAVGEAANLLTDDQRKFLTGAMQSTAPSPSATMSPMSDM
jgi:Spy/CpxP family protein refolding chaperone